MAVGGAHAHLAPARRRRRRRGTLLKPPSQRFCTLAGRSARSSHRPRVLTTLENGRRHRRPRRPGRGPAVADEWTRETRSGLHAATVATAADRTHTRAPVRSYPPDGRAP